MSEHVAFVVKVNKLEKHPNADRLMIATFFGNSTMVDLNVKEGDIGIYFPIDLQLSEEFCTQNNLVRRKDENGNNIGGYLDPDKRNITAMRLRGSKSEGLYLPISCLRYIYGEAEIPLHVGDKIDILEGHEICKKYIPAVSQPRGTQKQGNRTRKKKAPIAPLFIEHADTEQLAYNLDAFKPGDQIEITLKMHGTSQRTGYLPVLKGYKRTLLDRLLGRDGTPIYDWGYVTGTRRTVLDNFDGGFYGSNAFREPHAKFFEGKLHKGEEVYYEVVGFTDTGATIMGIADNKKTKDKAFIKQYGEKTIFSYGCEPTGKKTYYGQDEHGTFSIEKPAPQSDFYVYRMTMTNEDGDVVEYTPDYMRYRCEQMGCKCVPEFAKAVIYEDRVVMTWAANPNLISWFCYPKDEETIGDCVKHLAEEFYDGPDPIGKTHVREGVVIRIVNRPSFTAYKHKNFSFKVISGIAINDAINAGIELDPEIASEL